MHILYHIFNLDQTSHFIAYSELSLVLPLNAVKDMTKNHFI